jgi:hypothetical protein
MWLASFKCRGARLRNFVKWLGMRESRNNSALRLILLAKRQRRFTMGFFIEIASIGCYYPHPKSLATNGIVKNGPNLACGAFGAPAVSFYLYRTIFEI